jgi:hypothetical protein
MSIDAELRHFTAPHGVRASHGCCKSSMKKQQQRRSCAGGLLVRHVC